MTFKKIRRWEVKKDGLVYGETILAVTGGVIAYIPLMLGGENSPVPDYHGILLDDVWHYGMIMLGLGILGLSVYLIKRRGN